MKTKNLTRLIIVAVFMAMIMSAVFVLPRLGFPLKAFAETTQAKENLKQDDDSALTGLRPDIFMGLMSISMRRLALNVKGTTGFHQSGCKQENIEAGN